MPKDTLAEEKMFGPYPKMLLKKDGSMPIVIGKQKRENFDLFGFNELMPEQGNTVCLILNLWVSCQLPELR